MNNRANIQNNKIPFCNKPIIRNNELDKKNEITKKYGGVIKNNIIPLVSHETKNEIHVGLKNQREAVASSTNKNIIPFNYTSVLRNDKFGKNGLNNSQPQFSKDGIKTQGICDPNYYMSKILFSNSHSNNSSNRNGNNDNNIGSNNNANNSNNIGYKTKVNNLVKSTKIQDSPSYNYLSSSNEKKTIYTNTPNNKYNHEECFLLEKTKNNLVNTDKKNYLNNQESETFKYLNTNNLNKSTISNTILNKNTINSNYNSFNSYNNLDDIELKMENINIDNLTLKKKLKEQIKMQRNLLRITGQQNG